MGARRVVLARELNLAGNQGLPDRTQVELEIFGPLGALLSYSGLCLASSFRGGTADCRDAVVQPCRLQFKQGRDEGFFLFLQ